jgi:hypothetical protein
MMMMMMPAPMQDTATWVNECTKYEKSETERDGSRFAV